MDSIKTEPDYIRLLRELKSIHPHASADRLRYFLSAISPIDISLKAVRAAAERIASDD